MAEQNTADKLAASTPAAFAGNGGGGVGGDKNALKRRMPRPEIVVAAGPYTRPLLSST
jgi:hypothetical protein